MPPYPPECSLLQPLSWPQRSARTQGLSSVLPTNPSSTASPLTAQNLCTAEHYPAPFAGKTIRFWLVGFSPPQHFSFGPTLWNPWSEASVTTWKHPWAFTSKSVSVKEFPRHPQPINFPAQGNFSLRLVSSTWNFTYCAGMRNWSLSPEAGTGVASPSSCVWQYQSCSSPGRKRTKPPWECTAKLLQLTAPSTPWKASRAFQVTGLVTQPTLGCSCSPGLSRPAAQQFPYSTYTKNK